jgi:DNA-binding transcriptional LysR family regulator
MVYDQSIGAGGLRWCELQAWWKDTRQITDDEAKKTLYGRLISSLPDNSPPQRNLFAVYHHLHAPVMRDLLALLPEEWPAAKFCHRLLGGAGADGP